MKEFLKYIELLIEELNNDADNALATNNKKYAYSIYKRIKYLSKAKKHLNNYEELSKIE